MREVIGMFTDENDRTLKEYRELEMQLHIDLMGICRKYISRLGIVSIMGIFDIVKQEAMELERATREDIKDEEEKAKKREEEMLQQQREMGEPQEETPSDNYFNVDH